jgi:NTE family protein
MPHRRKTFGLALGGGFARGVTHIGVIKVLEEEKIPIDFIAGTSAGALMGAFYCSGLSAGEIEEVARAVRFRDFARWTLSRYGFCSNDRMVRFLAKVLSVKSFSDLKIPLAIVATDFRTGEPVVFTEGELFDPVRASCAYPGMFLPVEFGGRQYVDGMLAYAVPTTPLRQMGADCVLGVHLSAHWASGPAPRHVFEIMGQCLSIAQARLYDLWKKDADLVLEPDMSDFSYDCFERVGELIHVGEQAMREMLPSLRTLLNLPSPAEVVREPTPVEMITASEPAGIDAVSFAS